MWLWGNAAQGGGKLLSILLYSTSIAFICKESKHIKILNYNHNSPFIPILRKRNLHRSSFLACWQAKLHSYIRCLNRDISSP